MYFQEASRSSGCSCTQSWVPVGTFQRASSAFSQVSTPNSPSFGTVSKRQSIRPERVSYATTSPGMFMGQTSLGEARVGTLPVCIVIEATSTFPRIAAGDVFATRPALSAAGRSLQRRSSIMSTAPAAPKSSTRFPVRASRATSWKLGVTTKMRSSPAPSVQ